MMGRVVVPALVAWLIVLWPMPTMAEGECVTVLNKGVGGSSSRDLLKSFAVAVEAFRPQHVVILVGMNDAGNTNKLVPMREYEHNLSALVEKTRGLGARAYLVTVHAIVEAEHASRHKPELLPPEGMNKKLAEYNVVVEKVAVAKGVPLIRFDEVFELRGGPRKLTRNKENMNISDGVHLTAEGYRLLAQTVFDVLRGRVKPGESVVCLGDSLTFGSGIAGQGSATGQTYPAWLWAFLNGQAAPPAAAGGTK